MHTNSMILMEGLLKKYVAEIAADSLVYDVGSYNVNGCYKGLFNGYNCKYIGIDIVGGNNVDVVVDKDEEWGSIINQTTGPAPLVISGSCFEHVERPWEWINQVKNLMTDGGLFLLITHASWPEHRYPVDCWRILPDGMRALAKYAGLNYVEGGLSNGGQHDSRGEDCWAVFRK